MREALAQAQITTDAVRVIDTTQPTIFCWGFLWPVIAISRGLVEELTSEELVSVLRHEDHHRMTRSPLTLFIVQCVATIFFFIPGLTYAREHFETTAEIRADQYATKNFTDKESLVSALYKVIGLQERALISQTLAVSFFGAITDGRIQALVASSSVKDARLFPRHLLGALVAAGIVSVAMFSLSFLVPDARAESSGSFCRLIPSHEVYRCEVRQEFYCAHGPSVSFCKER